MTRYSLPAKNRHRLETNVMPTTQQKTVVLKPPQQPVAEEKLDIQRFLDQSRYYFSL